MQTKRLFLVCASCVIWGFSSSSAAAQEPPRPVTDDQVNAIARDMYCPVCESTPLDVCPTRACADWREQIRVMLAQGQSAAEIKEYFVRQYGPRVLAEPPRQGFSAAIWLGPPLLALAAALLFGRYLGRIRINTAAGQQDIGDREPRLPAASDYVARVERESREQET